MLLVDLLISTVITPAQTMMYVTFDVAGAKDVCFWSNAFPVSDLQTIMDDFSVPEDVWLPRKLERRSYL